MAGLAKTKKDLSNILRYTEELLSINDKVVFDLAREPYPQFHEHQAVGLEGVDTAVDEEAWVRVRRLREIHPPAADPMFDGWVDFGQHPSPDHPPRLLAERMLNITIEEISDLGEAGLLPDPDDVMRPVGSDQAYPERMDVILRVANMPDFRRLWQEYLNGPWAAWAEVERPRRRSIDFYNKLYQIHQRMLAMGDDTPIELVFGVGMARWKVKDERINVPLIDQLVEIELEEDDGTLLVCPRQSSPQLMLRPFHAMEIEGSKGAQRDVGESFDRIVDDPDRGFSPFDKATFENVLRACAAHLSASGIYHPEDLTDSSDRTLPNIDDVLRITDTWVIYVRQRNEDFRKEDIRRLIKKLDEVESEAELPPPGVRFVEEPSDAPTVHPDDPPIDLSGTVLVLPKTTSGQKGGQGSIGSGQGGGGGEPRKMETYFFPLPYNDDQEEIIRRLEAKDSDGVLVQGPPGTGKTHTIANIICHYLATKRRVLVTAKSPEALTALQEKLPEGIRDLAIAVIHNDREGARQLEHAVRILADEAKSINVKATDEARKEKEGRIAELRETIARIDRQLFVYAERNLARLRYGEIDVLPMELAKAVTEERPLHQWFDDQLTTEPKFEPQFDDAEMEEVRQLRRHHAGDLAYSVTDLPDPARLPELPRVLAAHSELIRINQIVGPIHSGEIPVMALEGTVGLEGAKQIRAWVAAFAEVMADLEAERWLFDIYHMLIGLKRADAATIAALKAALSNWLNLYGRGREFSLKAVIIGEPDGDQAFDKAVEDLAAGKQPFGMFSFFKGGLKAKVEAVRVEGRAPANAEDWSIVHGYRIWQQQVVLFLGRWSGIARAVGAPVLPTDWTVAETELLRLGRLVERVWAVHENVEHHRQLLKELFPYGLHIDDALHHGRCERVIEALAANLEQAELADAHAVKAEALAVAGNFSLPFHSALHEICRNLGQAEVAQAAVAEAWRQIMGEAARLNGIREDLARLDALVGRVAASGAPHWAERLRRDPPRSGDDPWTQADWRKSWEWARADGYLHSLGDRETVRRLSEDRARAEAQQKRLFGEVVRLRTFLGLKLSLTNRVETALAKFAAAIARLGKGTGKTAGRQRRIIRDAAMDTAQAVPCWILPEWRVAEQLPPDLAAFDLVVIDEASQSDILAFPALLRGKKVLIVGDDKQVSPSTVGIDDRKLTQLRTTFLTGLPFANQMDPATSLYELGGMVFPGKAIMLREHFRCVEPIIRFSSRFYPSPLVPLRLPKASERLDPPLIDIFVPHGRKHRETNPAEADVIVSEIGKLAADPKYEKRSIGVISLIGAAQAKSIYDRLVSELGAEVMEKHRIMCGSSATFQGQERDIIFLSMVACPETAMAQTQRMFEQRFNVAASRARDRLVLVRSVSTSDLKPGDLKLALIEHFRSPMEEGKVIHPGEVLDLCDSKFERDFGRCLLELGYRLKPQVPVGGYRIDFVIEGADDRRLAIELDGDMYHGPDKWAEDVRRQKALERLGWVFWRCWGSSWIADRQGCLDDLRATLDRLGIEPLGMAPIDGVYTLHVEVPPPGTEEDFATEVAVAEPAPQWQAAPTDEAPVPAQAVPLPASLPAPGPEPEHELVFDDSTGAVAEAGDLVTIRYDDKPDQPVRVRLSKTEHRPEEMIIHVSEPVGEAVLGASVDDEIEVVIGGKARTAVVERIEKGPSAHAQRAAPADVETPRVAPFRPTITAQPMRHLPPSGDVGCDLGDGAILGQGEEIYCHLSKRDLEWRKPEGTAAARDGALFMDGKHLRPQRGAWLQEALRIVQQQVGHAATLNAWIHWYVRRDGQLIPVAELRTVVHTRAKRTRQSTDLTLEDLGL
jgi:very-short-patch-repair endonuclease